MEKKLNKKKILKNLKKMKKERNYWKKRKF